MIITCCLNTLSLNLSKSVSWRRLALPAIRLAQAVCSHFVLMSASSYAFFSCFSLAEREILTLKSVRESLLKLRACLLTPVQGPSIRAWKHCKFGIQAMEERLVGQNHTHSSLVHHVNYDTEFALIWPLVNQGNTPYFYKPLIHLRTAYSLYYYRINPLPHSPSLHTTTRRSRKSTAHALLRSKVSKKSCELMWLLDKCTCIVWRRHQSFDVWLWPWLCVKSKCSWSCCLHSTRLKGL